MTLPPSSPRPKDLALLLLSANGPPRLRARDQRADVLGGEIRAAVLDRLVAIDPEPEALAATLSEVIEALGEPSGPTRAACVHFLQEWADSLTTPGYWPWLLNEAIAAAEPREGRRRSGDLPEE